MKFIATLDLRYDIGNPDHRAQADPVFALMWPEGAGESWREMEIDAASPTALVAELDHRFTTELKGKSLKPPKGAWTLQPPFAAAQWRVGAGGVHESVVHVQYEDGGMNEWTFSYGAGTAYVNVMARWRKKP